AFTLIAGELFRGKSHTDPLRLEHLVVSHFTIGLHLLLIFVSNLRMHALRQRLGRFLGRNPNRFAGFGVDKSSRHLAPVAEFQSALSQPAARHHHNRIGRAAVNLHKSDNPFSVFALGIIKAKGFEAEHGHPYSQYLSGAKVPVSDRRVLKILVKILHSGPSPSLAASGCRSAPRARTTKLLFSPATLNVTRLGLRSHFGAGQPGPVNSFLRIGLRLPSSNTTIYMLPPSSE